MISDKELERLAWLGSAIGIIILFFLSQSLEPLSVHTTDITDDMLGRQVRLTGFVSSAYEKNGTVFLKISDKYSSIDAVIFERTADKLDYIPRRNDTVLVEGKLTLYNNEPEIIVSSVTKK